MILKLVNSKSRQEGTIFVKLHKSSVASKARTFAKDQRGLSLIEVIVALGLVTLLAVVALPLFTSALRLTTVGATSTGATARVQAVIEKMRTPPISCGDLQNLTIAETQADARGEPITVRGRLIPPTGSTVACNASSSNAQSVAVEVSAVRDRDNKRLVSIRTNIFVAAPVP